MANNARDIRNNIRKTEEHARNIAGSAASSARSNADTARAAQSTATASWIGAGFQAATAFQTARAAQAAEEQAALQRAAAEQTQVHEFAMWRQTPNGMAFVTWREQAARLAGFLRNREVEWLSGWARLIGRAQAETPEAEKRRFMNHPARLKQSGLKIAVVICLVLAGFFTLGLLMQLLVGSIPQSTSSNGITYEECMVMLGEPGTIMTQANCDALKPDVSGRVMANVIPLTLFAGLGIVFLVMRKSRQHAARADQTVAIESQARIARWGFDPLAVRQGYAGFPWCQSHRVDGYADRLMDLALRGHLIQPAQGELLGLFEPVAHPSHGKYQPELNEVLTKFQHERFSLR